MAKPRQTLLCLLDVLGFESALRKVGLEALHAKYEQLCQLVSSNSGGGVVGIDLPDGPAVATVFVQHAYFSDTIMFWMNYDPIKAQWFTRRMAEVICAAIEVGLPLRGAFTRGNAIFDTQLSTFLGDPLVEAARTEKDQAWIGASFGPSLANMSDHRFYPFLIQRYSAQYKDKASPRVTGLALDWPRWWRETRKSDLLESVRRLNDEPLHSSYYQTTMDFIDYSLQNVDWFRRVGR